MICVLLVAAGAGWESAAVTAVDQQRGMVLLKRCVDVDDLMAAATTGQAHAAVVALDAPGLDAAAADHLRRHGVVTLAVAAGGDDPAAARLRAGRIGIAAVVEEDDVAAVPGAVEQALGPDGALAGGAPATAAGPSGAAPGDEVAAAPAAPGRVIAVWGPRGAPGRTLLATTLAAEIAHCGVATTLVDADPFGGAVAQVLGVMDEVSGLLAATRMSVAGELEQRLATAQRLVSPGLSVVTGLPRADRWTEIRGGALEHLLEVARQRAVVVVDTGPDLSDDDGGPVSRPGRNRITTGALEVADEVVVVGTADPVGLSRLARGLVDLREVLAGTPVRVVVNRMRPSLGWSEAEIASMVEGFARLRGLHFVPEDVAGVDRALVAGSTLRESGEEPIVRAVASLVDAVAPRTAEPSSGRARTTSRLRRRTAAGDRRR